MEHHHDLQLADRRRSSAPPATFSSPTRTRSRLACLCSSRVNVKVSGSSHSTSRNMAYSGGVLSGAKAISGRWNHRPLPPKTGPKSNYVRTDEVERQVIRHRFLDPDASVDIIAQKLRQAGSRSAPAAWIASSRSTACKKKLYRYRPGTEPPIDVWTNRNRTKPTPCDPRSIEYGVRQFLADKVVGNLAGIWLLVPELLRLGALGLGLRLDGTKPEPRRTAIGVATDSRGGAVPYRIATPPHLEPANLRTGQWPAVSRQRHGHP